MGEVRQPLRINLWLGLNTRDNDLSLRPGASPALSNIEFHPDGWKTRNGITKKNTAATGTNQITGIFDGFNHILMTEGVNLHRWDGVSAWTSISSGLTSGAVPQFVSFKALDIFTNGSDEIQKWDGSSLADLNSAFPLATTIEVFQNRVFVAGLPSPNQDELRYSLLEDPTGGIDNQFLRVSERQKGADIIGLKHIPVPNSDQGVLGIFCSDQIFHFSGFTKSNFFKRPVNSKIGAIASKGIVVAEEFVYWMDENGIYASRDGGQSFNLISWNIQPTFDDLAADRLKNAVAVNLRYKRQVWWTVAGEGVTDPNTILVYNYGISTPELPSFHPDARHVWSVYDGLDINTLAEVLQSSAYEVWGGSSDTDGFVYQMDKGTDDDGTAISWSLDTARILLTGSWSLETVLRKLIVVHDTLAGATMKVDLFLDGATTIGETQTLNLAGVGGAGVFGIGVFGTATFGEAPTQPSDCWYNNSVNAVKFKFSGDTKDKLVKCYELAIEHMARRTMT